MPISPGEEGTTKIVRANRRFAFSFSDRDWRGPFRREIVEKHIASFSFRFAPRLILLSLFVFVSYGSLLRSSHRETSTFVIAIIELQGECLMVEFSMVLVLSSG